MGKSHSEQSAIQPGKGHPQGSPKDHTLGEITKGCVIPRSLRVGLLPWQFLSWHP